MAEDAFPYSRSEDFTFQIPPGRYVLIAIDDGEAGNRKFTPDAPDDAPGMKSFMGKRIDEPAQLTIYFELPDRRPDRTDHPQWNFVSKLAYSSKDKSERVFADGIDIGEFRMTADYKESIGYAKTMEFDVEFGPKIEGQKRSIVVNVMETPCKPTLATVETGIAGIESFQEIHYSDYEGARRCLVVMVFDDFESAQKAVVVDHEDNPKFTWSESWFQPTMGQKENKVAYIQE